MAIARRIGFGLKAAVAMMVAPPALLNAQTQSAPLHLNPLLRSNDGLVELPPWPAEMIKHGGGKNYELVVFRGDTVVAIYDASDMTVSLKDQPYDEFVYVIRGQVKIKPLGGVSRTFGPGDFFISPKGFTGTWETSGRYRELYTIDKGGFATGSEYSEEKKIKR